MFDERSKKMNKDSLSYKKGFSKGIEIYSENFKKDGYYADDNNKGLVNAFKKYSESGFKKGVFISFSKKAALSTATQKAAAYTPSFEWSTIASS